MNPGLSQAWTCACVPPAGAMGFRSKRAGTRRRLMNRLFGMPPAGGGQNYDIGGGTASNASGSEDPGAGPLIGPCQGRAIAVADAQEISAVGMLFVRSKSGFPRSGRSRTAQSGSGS